VPRNPIDLASLDTVKAILDIDTSVVDDGNIQLCITAASRTFLRMTGRGLSAGRDVASPFNTVVQYTEGLTMGRDYVWPRNSPIQAVISLSIDGVAISQADAFGNNGWSIESDGAAVAVRAGSYGFRRGEHMRCRSGRAQIVYTAGYPAYPQLDLATIPAGGAYAAAVSPWLSDGGVTYTSTGIALAAVTANPAVGQYTVDTEGNYTFNASESGVEVSVAYQTAGTPEDITLAVAMMASLAFQRQDWIGLKSNTQHELGTTVYDTTALPESVTDTIRNYRRRVR
jgi:hypothetical protein